MNKSELLLPVGNMQMCLAAIHNGADAIYVGMPGFNARGRSHDHEFEELKEIIDLCHLYGVKVHIAFNILIFENEITEALTKLDQVMELGPDAFIIQDIGLAKLVRSKYPSMVIHGSTQMSITNHEAIELLDDLDIQRFVLGRENSIDEIEKIKSKTNKELEVFVHGALCVAYSGQCFTSESLGGRSANRGQCAQSCRFNYDLYVDDEKRDLNGREYLVSPKDLCGVNEVPKLQEIGVESFKVEGRLKSAEFVATVAKTYKDVIDKKPIDLSKSISDMAVTYSRGFYSGWLNGVAHQNLVSADYKSHRGQYLGEVKFLKKHIVYFDSDIELSNGDGLLFVLSSGLEVGDKIYSSKNQEGNWVISLGPSFDVSKLSIGDKVYLNRKEDIIKATKRSVTDRDHKRRIPIDIEVTAVIGEQLIVSISDGLNNIVLNSTATIEKASNRPLSFDELQKNLSGLSHTPYLVDKFKVSGDKEFFIHNRELKVIKQDYILKLNELRTSPAKHEIKEILASEPIANNVVTMAKLNILIRNKSQLLTILDSLDDFSMIDWLILDYEFGKDYFESVNLSKNKSIKVAIATTRILKPNEYHNFRLIERSSPNGILIRNLGALNYFKDSSFTLFSDFSLNIANSHTFNYLKNKGLKTLCLSYDLNIEQLNNMLTNIDNSFTELTIHQYMPEFHMEHCVFAAFMSKGNSFRDCGKPCEKHKVHMIDMYGHRHELKADQECRNTMYNATAQSTVKYLDHWKSLGVSRFRFECLHEDGTQLIQKIQAYLDLLSGKTSQKQAYAKLGQVESYGLGTGQIDNVRKFSNRKK